MLNKHASSLVRANLLNPSLLSKVRDIPRWNQVLEVAYAPVCAPPQAEATLRQILNLLLWKLQDMTFNYLFVTIHVLILKVYDQSSFKIQINSTITASWVDSKQNRFTPELCHLPQPLEAD